jgi:hypothetical protein
MVASFFVKGCTIMILCGGAGMGRVLAVLKYDAGEAL